jgi:hypothetical protein
VKPFFLLLASALITSAARAEDDFKPNYDEAAVPAYRLPDPLVFENGLPVKDADDWEKRRAEILALFGTHIYGHTPTTGEVGITHEKRKSIDFLAGKAVLEEIRISVTNKQARTRHIDLLLIKPKAPEGTAFRTFLTINFLGNHTLHPSPDISLPESWQSQQPDGIVVNHRATEKGRGYSAAGWPIETIIDSGIAFASVCYHDIEPDSPEHYGESVRAFFDKPEADGWGSIGAWAWGLSRAMDYIVTDPQIDAKRVAVMGHSRLGKAALWAAAQDQRFALAISNNSGCGGAALSRRAFGETVQRINQGFPYWFCRNFHQYNNNESALPVDQHQLISLIAPRMIHVASAENDRWADPRGEFLSALHASPVWKLHGLKGIEAAEMPPIHQPTGDRVRYHIRAGEHDVTEYDWKQYIDSLLMVP